MDGKQVEHWLVLDDDEHEAMGYLLEFMWKLRKWGMTANQVEMEAAVHVLQGFVIQHMLHRLEPGRWAAWTREGCPDV